MNLHKHVKQQLSSILDQDEPDEAVLQNALRLLAKYRSTLIQNTIIKLHGTQVLAGPFAGMKFVESSAEGCHVPKLLGCYEEELHPFIMSLPERGYTRIINIGCAEGYYAVGLKLLLPDVEVLAFDINPAAQSTCIRLAQQNGVTVKVAGEFSPSDFASYSEGKTLVWCDIEGGELGLLDPVQTPILANMDFVVELHPTASGHSADHIPPRFLSTHSIETLYAEGHKPCLPPFMHNLGHLDQLLAQWEWRAVATPWVVMLSAAG